MSFQLVSSSSFSFFNLIFIYSFLSSFFCFFWPTICFAQALVPTYGLYLNIIYYYSARLAFQLFQVPFFCINILCVYIKCNFSIW